MDNEEMRLVTAEEYSDNVAMVSSINAINIVIAILQLRIESCVIGEEAGRIDGLVEAIKTAERVKNYYFERDDDA